MSHASVRAAWGAAVLALFTSSGSAAALRANYEVTLDDGGKTYSIRTSQAADASHRFVEELGPFKLEMIPAIQSNGAYALDVSLTRRVSSPAAVAPVYSKSIPGALGGPLEFSAQFGEIQATGAVVLHRTGE